MNIKCEIELLERRQSVLVDQYTFDNEQVFSVSAQAEYNIIEEEINRLEGLQYAEY